MTNTYVNMDGVENVACSMIKFARKDFIKGAKVLYSNMNCIPTQKELLKDPNHHTLNNNADVRWMYDSWRFVRDDPYNMFGEVGEVSIINSWKLAAIIDYYKDLYIAGAVDLYVMGAEDPDKVLRSEIDKKLTSTKAREFMLARNYIYTLPDGKSLIKEWNQNAFDRARKKKAGKGRIPINKTEYAKQRHTARLKNIEKAKKLHKAGFSTAAIAKEMGLTTSCIGEYLRS